MTILASHCLNADLSSARRVMFATSFDSTTDFWLASWRYPPPVRKRFGAVSESGGSRMRPMRSSNCSFLKTGLGPSGAAALPPSPPGQAPVHDRGSPKAPLRVIGSISRWMSGESRTCRGRLKWSSSGLGRRPVSCEQSSRRRTGGCWQKASSGFRVAFQPVADK